MTLLPIRRPRALPPGWHTPAVLFALLGLDLVPYGRGDLLWVAEDRDSDALVGEFDGVLRPPLTAYGGVRTEKTAYLATFGTARIATASRGDGGTSRQAAGAFRPGLDVQRYLGAPEVGPVAWLGAGAYGVIPTAVDLNDLYTEAEAQDAEAEASDLRARIGGVGLRVGVGGDYRWGEGLVLGLRYHLVGHRGQALTSDTLTVSTLTYGEAGLRLQLEI